MPPTPYGRAGELNRKRLGGALPACHLMARSPSVNSTRLPR